MAGAYQGFCSRKQVRVLLLPPRWDASPSSPTVCRWYPFIHLGGERQCGVKFLVQGNNTIAGTGHQTTNLQTPSLYLEQKLPLFKPQK